VVIINITNFATNSHYSWPHSSEFLDIFGRNDFALKMQIVRMEIRVEVP
jgi:hypothetical protein